MNVEKEKLLHITYQKFMATGLNSPESLDILNDLASPNIMGFGTTVDERIFSIADLKNLLVRQREQSEGMQLQWVINPVFRKILKDENSALFVDDVLLCLTVDEETVKIQLRYSMVLEYQNNKWIVIHFHGSKPENVTTEKDTFGIEEWKKRNAALEKLVLERTADLVIKNRELEIEAALERVRTIAMSMKKRDDMLETCQSISTQLEILQVKEIRNVQTAIFYEDKEVYINYEYYTKHDKKVITETSYKDNKLHNTFVQQLLKGKTAGFETELKGKELKDWYAYQKQSNQFADTYLETAASLYYYWYSLGTVAMGISTYEALTENEKTLFHRFKKVFELAYRRYLDIEQAETQAKEVQIELALERVRARTMAMQHSDELREAVLVIYEQLQQLGFESHACNIIIIDKDTLDMQFWVSGFIHQIYPESYHIPRLHQTYHEVQIAAWQQGVKYQVFEYSGKGKIDFDKIFFTKTDFKNVPEDAKKVMIALKSLKLSTAFFNYGALQVLGAEVLSEDKAKTLQRFAKVFEQTYTRFLDLQKAEAQTRENEIELALERVRSRTMTMQRSSELREIVAAIYEQLRNVGFTFGAASIVIMDKATGNMDWWIHGFETPYPESYQNSYFEHPFYLAQLNNWKEGKKYAVMETSGESKKLYDDYVFSKTDFKRIPEATQNVMKSFEKITFSNAYMKYGALSWSTEPINDNYANTLQRFAYVFEQSYTRYLDIKQAEAQAKEAQIETALERVRSRTMAMQHSNELAETASLLFKQVIELGVNAFAIVFQFWLEDGISTSCWASGGDGMQPTFRIPHTEESFHLQIYEAWKKGENFFVMETEGVELEEAYQFLSMQMRGNEVLDNIENSGFPIPKFQVTHCAFFLQGYIMFNTHERTPEAHDIFKRFGKVFEQTYTRFLDLQKAEAQAKEAQIETALERVRSRTMAMQSSNELQETAAVLFQEFKKLGANDVYQVTIGIYDEVKQLMDFRVTSWANNGEQESRSFSLDMNEPTLLQPAVAAWKAKKKSAVFDLTDEALQGWLNYCNKISGITKMSTDTGGRRVITAAYYSKGHLTISTPVPPPQETIKTLERFAAVFDGTYTRFLDLEKAEVQAEQAEQDLIAIKEAKQKAEEALTELQATQKQLIQSEKMASLGELTAGIAHEIQNPLNFVNNFSEVSTELVDEMNEEINRGNLDDAKEIANDLKQNLEKINHHGKRAGDIVKGMLQHSSSGSGKKELTDINKLADEYLRLAYHGLRAKDKSFNATMKTDFDESIGNINIIPQDIGRVILNLITNAFYVVAEKKKQIGKDYEPIVTVSTSRSPLLGRGVGGEVKISVKDNGNGIPQKVLDKIFQPFFTTKPTGQGTGLGLSLSYDIIKAHGGELTVQTKEGEFAAFVITLPI